MTNVTALDNYFQYTPSLPGNVIYLTAFVLITLILAWQTATTPGRLMWIVVLTGDAAASAQACHVSLQSCCV